ncbi:hypothetical protein COB72_03390 [bacterium]|nr:MAG: hypothetical protein COB72_03390 [bacterium]
MRNTVISITTKRIQTMTREHHARGLFAALIKLSTTKCPQSKKVIEFYEDFSGAVLRVVIVAVVPGVILVSAWNQQTAKMQYFASMQSQYSMQCSNDQIALSNQTNPHQTPDGFGVPLSQRGDHDTQKQD